MSNTKNDTSKYRNRKMRFLVKFCGKQALKLAIKSWIWLEEFYLGLESYMRAQCILCSLNNFILTRNKFSAADTDMIQHVFTSDYAIMF